MSYSNEAIELIENILNESRRWQYRFTDLYGVDGKDVAISKEHIPLGKHAGKRGDRLEAEGLSDIKDQEEGNEKYKTPTKEEMKKLKKPYYKPTALSPNQTTYRPEIKSPEEFEAIDRANGIINLDRRPKDNIFRSNRENQKNAIMEIINSNINKGGISKNKNYTKDSVKYMMKQAKDLDTNYNQVQNFFRQDPGEIGIPQKIKYEVAMILIEALNTLLNE